MPQIPRDTDKPAVTDEEIWRECDDRLKLAIEAEGENRSRAIEALEFGDGNQWPDDLYNQRKIDRRPSLTINHTNTFVRRVVNNMRQQRPRIKVHPVGIGANDEKASIVAGIIRHIENRSNASTAYDTGGESAVRMGWGYWRVLSEYIHPGSFDQELKVVQVRNPFTVYMDPSSVLPAGDDAEWVIITERMRRQEYARLFPDADNIEWRPYGTGDDSGQWETKTEIRLAEYFRICKTTEWLYQMTNGMAMYEKDIGKLESELAAAKVTKAIGSDGKPVRRKSFRQYVEWYRLNGRDIVDRRTEKDNPLPDRWIPIIRCEGNVLDINGKLRRKGMIADLMDPARMYNYWRTMETELLALAPKAPWIVAAGQTNGHPEWANANQAPHNVLTWEPVFLEQPDGSKTLIPPPTRTPPVEVPAGAVQAAVGAQQDLMAVAGMPHEPAADTPGSVVSGIALQRRAALSDIGHFQYYDNQTRAIAHTGRILVQLIPHYYSAPRMQRIIGEDGVPSMVPINTAQPNQINPAVMEVKNDLTIGDYDVVMDTGPGYETKRQEGAEAMIDLLKTPLGEVVVKVGSDLVVRNMDFAGASDLADRLMPMTPQGMQKAMASLPKQAQAIVTGLQQQLTQLGQENQQLKLELKYRGGIEQMRQRSETERETMRLRTKVHDTETSADTKEHDTAVRAGTAVKVAEIQAGAQLVNTHVEALHERALAAETAAAAEKAEKANGAAKP